MARHSAPEEAGGRATPYGGQARYPYRDERPGRGRSHRAYRPARPMDDRCTLGAVSAELHEIAKARGPAEGRPRRQPTRPPA